MEVHTIIGPGLPEGVYHEALAIEFRLRGLPFVTNPPLAIEYKGYPIRKTYHPDFIVDGHVVVELKAVETILDVHVGQVVSYLKMTKAPVGLLLNFNECHLKDGITRVVGEAGLFEEPSSSVTSVTSV